MSECELWGKLKSLVGQRVQWGQVEGGYKGGSDDGAEGPGGQAKGSRFTLKAMGEP